MLSENGIEGHQQFVIDGSSIEEYFCHNGLDTFNALSIDNWYGYLLWGQLYLGSIVNLAMLVG